MIELTILNGLPVTIDYDWNGYDNRDCGAGYGVVDDWYITHIAGRPVKKCDWLYKRIRDAKEEDRIIDACHEHHSEY